MSGLLEQYDHATREWRKAKSAVDNWQQLREATVYALHRDGMSISQIIRETEIERRVVQRMIRKVQRRLDLIDAEAQRKESDGTNEVV